jgi:hypothetical protein
MCCQASSLKTPFPAAPVSITESLFNSSHKEKSSLQSPQLFRRNALRLAKIRKHPSIFNHLQVSTIFGPSCDLPLVAWKAPSASNAEIVPNVGSLFPPPSDLPDPGTASSCQEAWLAMNFLVEVLPILPSGPVYFIPEVVLIASSLIFVPRECNFPQPIGRQHPARTRSGRNYFEVQNHSNTSLFPYPSWGCFLSTAKARLSRIIFFVSRIYNLI